MPTEDDTRPLHSGRHSADEWMLGLVRQLVLSILDERDRRYQERFEAQQEALGKMDNAVERRFESVNEFRKAMTDRDILYMPRAEAMSQNMAVIEKIDAHAREDIGKHDGLSGRIDTLDKRVNLFEGTVSGGQKTLATVAGIAVFLVAIISIGTWVFAGKQPATPQVIYVPAAPGTLVPTTPLPAQR